MWHCRIIKMFAVQFWNILSVLGTRTCSSQSPERFPKMAPECGLPILWYVTYHSSLHFEWWPMDQGSTVNTANDNKKLLRYKQPPPQESPLQWWIEASGIGCLTHPDAEITGRPTHTLMPSHIPSNYGYMFLGWEKIGVRLRYASWLIGRDKEQIASLFLLHPFPWVPTHLNLTSIFSHPQKHIPVNRDRVQVCRGPVEVVACPPILLYSPET